MRKKAAEELKKEQERKAAERRKVIDERCGLPKDLENASEGRWLSRWLYNIFTTAAILTHFDILNLLEEKLRNICKDYYARAANLESLKYDLEHEVVIKDYEVKVSP